MCSLRTDRARQNVNNSIKYLFFFYYYSASTKPLSQSHAEDFGLIWLLWPFIFNQTFSILFSGIYCKPCFWSSLGWSRFWRLSRSSFYARHRPLPPFRDLLWRLIHSWRTYTTTLTIPTSIQQSYFILMSWYKECQLPLGTQTFLPLSY